MLETSKRRHIRPDTAVDYSRASLGSLQLFESPSGQNAAGRLRTSGQQENAAAAGAFEFNPESARLASRL